MPEPRKLLGVLLLGQCRQDEEEEQRRGPGSGIRGLLYPGNDLVPQDAGRTDERCRHQHATTGR